MQTFDVALLTGARYTAPAAADGDWYLGNILADDRLFQEALARRGLTARRGDWSRFRCAVFRTTWDHFERFAEFPAWTGRAEGETRLCNLGSTVRWNRDKHYLADLATRGTRGAVAVPRTGVGPNGGLRLGWAMAEPLK